MHHNSDKIRLVVILRVEPSTVYLPPNHKAMQIRRAVNSRSAISSCKCRVKMMFKFKRECIINLRITIFPKAANEAIVIGMRLTRSSNTGVEHCRLSPGRIVFACFIECSTEA